MKKAFTFVELIVAITILAILSTVAFMSVKDYNTINSINEECVFRNSKEILETQSVCNSLGLINCKIKAIEKYGCLSN